MRGIGSLKYAKLVWIGIWAVGACSSAVTPCLSRCSVLLLGCLLQAQVRLGCHRCGGVVRTPISSRVRGRASVIRVAEKQKQKVSDCQTRPERISPATNSFRDVRHHIHTGQQAITKYHTEVLEVCLSSLCILKYTRDTPVNTSRSRSLISYRLRSLVAVRYIGWKWHAQ